jgi:hypothetical protein
MSGLNRMGFIVAVTTASLLTGREADACSCMRPPGATEAMAGSDHVALVRVTDITRHGGETPGPGSAPASLRVALDVERAFKGAPSKRLEIFTAASSAACGFHFDTGQRYLVYAHNDQDGTIQVSLCSRTQSAAQASADLEELARSAPNGAQQTPTPDSGAGDDPGTAPAPTPSPPPSAEPVAPHRPRDAPPASPTPPAAEPPPPQPPAQRGCACSYDAQIQKTAMIPVLGLLSLARRYPRRSRRVARRRRG